MNKINREQKIKWLKQKLDNFEIGTVDKQTHDQYREYQGELMREYSL